MKPDRETVLGLRASCLAACFILERARVETELREKLRNSAVKLFDELEHGNPDRSRMADLATEADGLIKQFKVINERLSAEAQR